MLGGGGRQVNAVGMLGMDGDSTCGFVVWGRAQPDRLRDLVRSGYDESAVTTTLSLFQGSIISHFYKGACALDCILAPLRGS